ncbi:efflux RND transporter periplasmic adaptor subunit [Acidihalobacter prosperus]
MRLLRPRYVIPAVLIAAAAGLLVWLQRPQPVTVAVATVGRGLVEASVANTRAGTVEACRRTKLSPAVGGQIARLDVHKGETVKQGQVLLELRNDDLKAQLALARSEASAAAAQTRSICLQADVAKREAARQTELNRRGMVSVEQADKAETAAKARAADCEGAHANRQVAEARVRLARANLDRTILTAPFAGVIADINGEVDEYVTPSPPGIATLPVIDLIDNSCFYVEAPIDEVDASKVRLGMPVRITLDAFGKQAFKGTVSRIGAYVVDLEKQARTVDVDVRFAHQTDLAHMLAGYSADVEIILASHANVLRVPTEAVINGNEVYVLDGTSGRLKLTRIEPGLSNWNWTEVMSGLRAGQEVVTSVDRKGVAEGVPAVAEKSPAK